MAKLTVEPLLTMSSFLDGRIPWKDACRLMLLVEVVLLDGVGVLLESRMTGLWSGRCEVDDDDDDDCWSSFTITPR